MPRPQSAGVPLGPAISGLLWLLSACGSDTIITQPEHPVPSVTSIVPDETLVGQDGITLTVHGANFVASSVIRWNGLERATTYVNDGTLRAAIPASDVAAAGTVSITVFTPPPGGGMSGAFTLTLLNPAPVATALSSYAVIAGHGGFTLAVAGTGFVASSVVRWNGSDRTTTLEGNGTLTALIPSSDVEAAGTASISVFTPPPGGGTSPGLTFAVLAPPVGRIAFDSWRQDDGEIYVMNADGTGQVNLSNSEGWDIFPVWSPDGSKLSFSSTRDGNFQGYVMNADGTGVVNITNSSARDGRPEWSPDGSKLAFTTNRDGNTEIYVAHPDGTGPTNLTNSEGSDTGPAWSPDGSKLAFTSDRDGNGEVYVMNADGTGVVNLTNSSANDGDPRWSPDGSKLAFECREGICLINADGTGWVPLVTSTGNDFDPDWSPDGSKLVFISTREGNWGVYVVSADGTGLKKLTNSAGDEWRPVWSPDGTWIAYELTQGEDTDIYLVTADGTAHVALTRTHGDRAPQWKPQPWTEAPPTTRPGGIRGLR